MSRWIANALLVVFLLASPLLAHDWHVAPNGTAEGDGTEQKPLDLRTALSDEKRIAPGDTVWLAGGQYAGPFVKPAAPSGTPEKPIVYRNAPGQRATLVVPYSKGVCVLKNEASNVWYWGLELTSTVAPEHADPGKDKAGDAFSAIKGDGLKLINLVIHDFYNGNGLGAWAVGSDNEFYGCLIYRNGFESKAQAHGTYTQNLDKFGKKTFADCIFGDNFGYGIHCYGQEKSPNDFVFEGVVSYCNGIGKGAEKIGVNNILVGGYKEAKNISLKECYAYFPTDSHSKRGVDIGYVSKSNTNVAIEKCVFSGGGQGALWLLNWTDVKFVDNTVLTWSNMAARVEPGPDADTTLWHVEGNTYCRLRPEAGNPFSYKGTPIDTFAKWQKTTGFDAKGRYIEGQPTEAMIFLRPNRYEPERAHLVIYNWPKSNTVTVDLGKRWGLAQGAHYAVKNVDDIWGKSVAEGDYAGGEVTIPVTGQWAPEFVTYVLIRNGSERR